MIGFEYREDQSIVVVFIIFLKPHQRKVTHKSG